MPNIEIKARCNNLKKALDIVHEIKTDYVGSLHQVDTYYETKEGRLKLREINDIETQLIPYYKEYSTGPMKSSYSVLPVNDKKNLKAILEKILGQVIVVDKQREVFLVDNIRIHLDEVKGLGSFIEFEAVYEENSSLDKEREVKKVDELKDIFQIDDNDLLDKSYIDFFLNKETKLILNNLRTLFFFTNDTFSIIEVEKLVVNTNEPPEKRYFWFSYDNEKQKLSYLDFVSMDNEQDYQYRKLGNIDLKFNLEGAEVKSPDFSAFLHQKHPMFMQSNLKRDIINFFNS